MDRKQYLLSVCIPTYNGEGRIVGCLNALSSAVGGLDNVEVIVSDNCSTDSTYEIIKDVKSIPNYRVYRNDKNLGFNGNIEKILKKYANGKYCWIIGDDDIVDSDALIKICEILEKYSPPFLSVNHRVLSLDEFNEYQINLERKFEYISCDYFSSIDINVSFSNVLGTFMSSQIFMLKDILSSNNLCIGENNWDDFRTTFPNSYLMTTTFFKSTNCGCIKTKVLTAIMHEKSWDDKMEVITMKILPDYYNFCFRLSSNKNSLKRTKEIIDYGILMRNIIYLKLLKINKIKWSILFKCRTYSLIFKYIKSRKMNKKR